MLGLATQPTGFLLKASPFFRKGAPLEPLLQEGGGTYSRVTMNRLLAEAFPARSLAAGKSAVDADDFKNEFNMQVEMKKKINGDKYYWPTARGAEENWKHSDIREVSFIYVYKLFEKFKDIGRLSE